MFTLYLLVSGHDRSRSQPLDGVQGREKKNSPDWRSLLKVIHQWRLKEQSDILGK